MEAMTYLCYSFLCSRSLPSAYLISYTQTFLGWINKSFFFFFFFKAGFDKADGGKGIYKSTKGTEAFHAYYIASVIRT